MLSDHPALATSPANLTEPPREDLGSYERGQRQRTLCIIIWTILIVAAVMGTFDIQFRTWVSVYTLYALSLLCVPALMFNARGQYWIAAVLLSIITLGAVSISIIDGDGVRDPGLMAFPVFIMAGTLFFGRRTAPIFGLSAFMALALTAVLQISGQTRQLPGPVGWDILVPLGVLSAAATGIVWAIMRNMEGHLERARHSEAELRRNYDLTLHAWARVMEYRDRETEGHSRRLVELSTRLARALGLDETEMVRLQRGALLHDIGKLAIPDEILLKPSTLTDAEMKIMQKHPVYARQMLADIPFLAASVPVAYSHHERWDGLGYPEGLKGEAIPVIARLFAIVDAWDALSSERVYRPAWPREQVVDYIKTNAGVRFDPTIVNVFLQMIQ